METNRKWNLAMLRSHAGERLLLGSGGVAITYALCGADRVRVSFFIYEEGRLRHCLTDRGTVQTLLKLLRRHARTGRGVRGPPLTAPRQTSPALLKTEKRPAPMRRPSPA